jgi:hypothetical protein
LRQRRLGQITWNDIRLPSVVIGKNPVQLKAGPIARAAGPFSRVARIYVFVRDGDVHCHQTANRMGAAIGKVSGDFP